MQCKSMAWMIKIMQHSTAPASFDKQTGYFTRSILCVPVVNKEGKVIGCTQVLNKSGGKFTDEDESRLKAFTQQVAIALENAKLFEDVSKSRKYKG